MLQTNEFDQASSIEYSAATCCGTDASQAIVVKDVLDLLVPSEFQNHLGRLGTYEVTGVERVTITDFGLARSVDDNTITQLGSIARDKCDQPQSIPVHQYGGGFLGTSPPFLDKFVTGQVGKIYSR